MSIVLFDDDREDEPMLVQTAKSKPSPPLVDKAPVDDTPTIIEVVKRLNVRKTEINTDTKEKSKKGKKAKTLKPTIKRDEIDDIFGY